MICKQRSSAQFASQVVVEVTWCVCSSVLATDQMQTNRTNANATLWLAKQEQLGQPQYYHINTVHIAVPGELGSSATWHCLSWRQWVSASPRIPSDRYYSQIISMPGAFRQVIQRVECVERCTRLIQQWHCQVSHEPTIRPYNRPAPWGVEGCHPLPWHGNCRKILHADAFWYTRVAWHCFRVWAQVCCCMSLKLGPAGNTCRRSASASSIGLHTVPSSKLACLLKPASSGQISIRLSHYPASTA